MKLTSTLFFRTLLWFFMTMLVIGLCLAIFFNIQIRIQPSSPLAGIYGTRMLALGNRIAQELNTTPPRQWDTVLTRYAGAYHIDLELLSLTGRPIAGTGMAVPAEVIVRIREHSRFILQRLAPLSPERRIPLPPPHFMARTVNPNRYWVGVPLLIFLESSHAPLPIMLLAASDSLTGGGLFFDPWPWIFMAASVVFLAALLWLPFVRHITRPLARMTNAAGEIARGRFEVRLDDSRTDEIGRLSRAINDMTAKLEGFVNGRKRFLGDIAHELSSPLARIQLGLGILGQRGGNGDARLQEVMREAEELAGLVEELLEFSRAEISPARRALAEIPVGPCIRRAVARESLDGSDIRMQVDDTLTAVADPELLTRALANVLRNAVRYAGQDGPITITAERTGHTVAIEVRDAGPGVPDEALAQLFEPFYRPEDARRRETGGKGLGLAIVKTCLEACQGEVSARNLSPGFAVTMKIKSSIPRPLGAPIDLKGG